MPAIVGVLALPSLVGGLYCYKNLDIEAYPNPVAPMIELITQPNGWSAEEVERYVTVPLEIGLVGHARTSITSARSRCSGSPT